MPGDDSVRHGLAVHAEAGPLNESYGARAGPTVKTATGAKLSNSDFRFLSAWLQGIDVHDAWDRFMLARGPADLRRIRSTTRTLLDVLVSVAKRHGDPRVAALLRRDPTRIKSSQTAMTSSPDAHPSLQPVVKSAPVPTLEQFAETLDDPDFYSQAELVELWEQRFGKVAAPPGQSASTHGARLRDTPENLALKRRGRLVKRQLEALKRLETLAASAPEPEDLVEAWLDIETASRLRAVGILRLRDLSLRVATQGYRWYRQVPRVGEERAGRLVRWLQQHEASLGVVPVVALVPRNQLPAAVTAPKPSIGLVPIERLQVPYSLSGESGSNRAPVDRCKAKARNDYEAVTEWLELRRPTGETGNANTYRAYRKEAERFLLWALFERRKALSDLDHTDCVEYRRFLATPGPMWTGPKAAQRWSELWRPFEGPLSIRSRRTAEVIVASMCTWLVQVRYLDSNPWDMVPAPSGALPLQELRSLSDPQWDQVQAWLERRPQTPANVRLLFMFRLALGTGMREAEMANAKVSWLRQDTDEDGEPAWLMRVVGKGGKEREVPLTKRLAQQLYKHLAWKGLMGEGEPIDVVDGNMPILSALEEPARAMAPSRIYELIKAALIACASEVEQSDPSAAIRIRKASPHWLRHTHGRKFVEAGGDRGILRQNLGHASDATTAIYDRSEVKRRRRDLERVFG